MALKHSYIVKYTDKTTGKDGVWQGYGAGTWEVRYKMRTRYPDRKILKIERDHNRPSIEF